MKESKAHKKTKGDKEEPEPVVTEKGIAHDEMAKYISIITRN